MARIDAHLIRKGARVLNARKGRLLDLRGNRIAEIENLGATEDQFDMINLSDNEIIKLENFPHMNRLGTLLIKNNMITHINPTLGEFLPKIHTLVLTKNCLTTLAEIDPLASLPSLKVLSLLDNTVTKLTDYRLYVVHTLKHLTLLDFMKVKREERIAATKKFHSKESYEEVKKSGAKAYCPVHGGDTQYTIKEHGPKVLSPTSERIMAIKAAIVNSETLNEVARIKGASTTGQILSESVITKPDANVADSPEGTDKMETGLKNEADENKVESTPIQQERLGTGVDSLSINPPGQIDEYSSSPAGENGPFMVSTLYRRPGYSFQSKEGKKLKGRDKLSTCLLVAKIHGVVSEEDFAAGCPPEAVRYRIEGYEEISDLETQMIPTWLDEAETILTSFRVTEDYRRILPHDIYRYHPPEKPADVHDAHCVVLISAGVEFKDAAECEEGPEWERYYEYINSYDGWGVDGCGYIYHDSLRKSYRIRVVDPEI